MRVVLAKLLRRCSERVRAGRISLTTGIDQVSQRFELLQPVFTHSPDRGLLSWSECRASAQIIRCAGVQVAARRNVCCMCRQRVACVALQKMKLIALCCGRLACERLTAVALQVALDAVLLHPLELSHR